MAVSTKQAELVADHGARLVNLENRDRIQNGKLDALAEAISGVRVDIAKLPGEIQSRVSGTMAKAAVAVLVGLILNAAAWWYRQ